jgi:hypothetical protein
MNEYQTGDLILFNGNGWLSWCLEYFGRCKFSHIGMIIVDPTPQLKGVYLLDISIATPSCVQLRPLNNVIKTYDGSVYYRKMIYKRDESFQQKIIETYNNIKDKPYDLNIFDWIASKILLESGKSEKVIFSNPKDTTKFFCSALIAYMYVNCSILPQSTPWTIIAPEDFTSSYYKFKLDFKCSFEQEKYLKKINL